MCQNLSMPDRCLADWLTLLESRHPSEIELGLGRVREVWERLQVSTFTSSTLINSTFINGTVTNSTGTNSSQSKPSIAITVAGTNGKGSCIASMQALLLQHGYSVGMFTSPHFLTYNERICLAGKPVSDAIIVAAFEEIEAVCGDTSLTYFEFGTLAALLVFRDASPDVMLLEVGLGGRLDAINIIDADVAVVTSIALDHQDWLGDTREAIAAEKIGIARANRPLLIGEQDYPQGFEQMIAATGADALCMGRDFSYSDEPLFSAKLISSSGPIQFDQLSAPGLLPVNKTLALQALLSAGITLNEQDSRKALDTVRLTGRHQTLSYQGVEVILDVAHNPAAAGALALNLSATEGRTLAIASVLEDKDWTGIVAAMSQSVDEWFIAQISDTARASKGQTLLEVLYNADQSGQLCESIEQALLRALKQATATDRIVVFGSFHTVAAVLKIILAEVSSE
jgi:dihydrofolate synthase/folylpolyglutamate synthase